MKKSKLAKTLKHSSVKMTRKYAMAIQSKDQWTLDDMDCECFIRKLKSQNYPFLVRCSLHNAAPELLKLLEETIDQASDDGHINLHLGKRIEALIARVKR